MTVALFYWAFIQNFILGGTIAWLKRDGPNYLLAGVFGLTGLNIFAQYIFRYTNLKFTLTSVIWIPDIVDFVVPSVLFLYLSWILNAPWPRRVYRYFIPAAIATLVLSGNVAVTENFSFFDYIRTDLHRGVLLSIFLWKSFMLWSAYRLLRDYRERLLAKSEAGYWWPKLLCLFLLASTTLAATNVVYMTWVAPYYPPHELDFTREVIQFTFVTFNSSIILAVFYYLVKHPKILSGKPILKVVKALEAAITDPNREKLMHAVEVERVYLDNDLNEKQLAEHLDLPPYVLSRLLNEDIGKSFSTFINEYRVAEAQNALRRDPDKQKTNFAIALESGFRSESVFYVNFKKYTGTTPSRYRKQVARETEAA